MPMQGLATVNMLVYNSMMQANRVKQSAKSTLNEMSCYQGMYDVFPENTEHINPQQLPH